jgi:hypothetical protein
MVGRLIRSFGTAIYRLQLPACNVYKHACTTHTKQNANYRSICSLSLLTKIRIGKPQNYFFLFFENYFLVSIFLLYLCGAKKAVTNVTNHRLRRRRNLE